MSARNYSDRRYSLERDVVDIFLRGTGPTRPTDQRQGKGIASITRTGAGAHTITLSDTINGMLMFQAMVIDPTGPVGWDVICTKTSARRPSNSPSSTWPAWRRTCRRTRSSWSR